MDTDNALEPHQNEFMDSSSDMIGNKTEPQKPHEQVNDIDTDFERPHKCHQDTENDKEALEDCHTDQMAENQTLQSTKEQKFKDVHVHFGSPLSLYHEYSVSEESSRTETIDSECSLDGQELDITPSNSNTCTEDDVTEDTKKMNDIENNQIHVDQQADEQQIDQIISINLDKKSEIARIPSLDDHIEEVREILEDLVNKCCDTVENNTKLHQDDMEDSGCAALKPSEFSDLEAFSPKSLNMKDEASGSVDVSTDLENSQDLFDDKLSKFDIYQEKVDVILSEKELSQSTEQSEQAACTEQTDKNVQDIQTSDDQQSEPAICIEHMDRNVQDIQTSDEQQSEPAICTEHMDRIIQDIQTSDEQQIEPAICTEHMDKIIQDIQTSNELQNESALCTDRMVIDGQDVQTSEAQESDLAVCTEHIDRDVQDIQISDAEESSCRNENHYPEDYNSKVEMLRNHNVEKVEMIMSPPIRENDQSPAELFEEAAESENVEAEIAKSGKKVEEDNSQMELFDSDDEEEDSDSIEDMNSIEDLKNYEIQKVDRSNTETANTELQPVISLNTKIKDQEEVCCILKDDINNCSRSDKVEKFEEHEEVQNETIDHVQCSYEIIKEKIANDIEENIQDEDETTYNRKKIANTQIKEDKTSEITIENISVASEQCDKMNIDIQNKTGSNDTSEEDKDRLSDSQNKKDTFLNRLELEQIHKESQEKSEIPLDKQSQYVTRNSNAATIAEQKECSINDKDEKSIKAKEMENSFDNGRKRASDTHDEEGPPAKVQVISHLVCKEDILTDHLVSEQTVVKPVLKEEAAIYIEQKTSHQNETNNDQCVPSVDCEHDEVDSLETYQDQIEDKKKCTSDIMEEIEDCLPDDELTKHIQAAVLDHQNTQVFKWKYAPSMDSDCVVPNLQDEESSGVSLMPVPLKTCKKPYRLGLSKTQKLPSLHPKLKRL